MHAEEAHPRKIAPYSQQVYGAARVALDVPFRRDLRAYLTLFG